MRGSIRSRSSGSREVKYEAGPDPKTGQRRTRYITVKGTNRLRKKSLRGAICRVVTRNSR
jgi:hypothetical protein